MTTKIWPSEFIADAKGKPGVVWGQEFESSTTSSDCANCGGRGFMLAWYANSEGTKYMPQLGVASSWHFVPEVGLYFTGEYHSAPCPVCSGGRKEEWLRTNSGLMGGDLDVRVSDFDLLDGKQEARELANNLLAMNLNPSGFVTFHGDYGRGKTFLLKGIVNSFRVIGVQSSYINIPDLLARIRKTYSAGETGNMGETIIAEFRGFRVLALDELDQVNLTDWSRETIFRLLDDRYNRRGSVLTLIAANHSPDQLDPTLAYLSSRMAGGTVVEIGGDDMRPADPGLREFAP